MNRCLARLFLVELCIALSLTGCTAIPPAARSLSVTSDSEGHTQIAESSTEIYTDEWLKEVDASLAAVLKRQIATWKRCQRRFALALARNTSDSPESIVLAIFEACRREEDSIRVNLIKLGSPDRAERFMDRLRQASRERLTLEIIVGRNPGNQTGRQLERGTGQ
jgi:hypothetical protein